jgi:uncharacterized protein
MAARRRTPRKRAPAGAPPVRVGTSPIHGKGLFATRAIRADTKIMRIEGVRTRRDGPHVIWSEEADGWHGFRITNEARYVNHADAPNAAFFEDELWSLRRIEAGEEITHDYSGALGGA